MTGVYRELSGLVNHPIPDDASYRPQPVLAPEITALLGVAGCTAKWTGFIWKIVLNDRQWAVSTKLVTFDDWRATITAVVEAGGRFL